jgi:hypothetical protein
MVPGAESNIGRKQLINNASLNEISVWANNEANAFSALKKSRVRFPRLSPLGPAAQIERSTSPASPHGDHASNQGPREGTIRVVENR